MAILKYLILYVFMIAFLFYDNLSAFSKNEIKQNHCLSCHKTIYEKGVSSSYQHSPFEKRECVACHLKHEGISPVRDKGTLSVKILESVALSSPDYLEEHTIFLRELIPEAVYDINVVLKDMSRNTLRKEFKGVTPAKVQDIKTDDEKPPVISGIKVGPIKRAIFLETTITWTTDKPSTSYVTYWISEQYRKHVPEDINLVKHHQVTLYNLVAGKEYHFYVASRDMFGNEVVSEDMIFNTATISKTYELEDITIRKGGAVELAVNKMDFFLLNSALGLHLETTKPANVTVEYVKVEDPTVPNEPQIEPASVLRKPYPSELRSGKELAINACYNCHPLEELGLTHPVGVALKRTTKIPKDLPTLKGGIITCVTCHDAHGASRPYLARKDMTRDICISCHDGY